MIRTSKMENKKANNTNPQINPDLYQALANFEKNGKIDCASAHTIAAQLNLSPIEIGKNLDRIGLKVTRCQLGLFGYGQQKKKFNPDFEVSSKINDRIKQAQSNQDQTNSIQIDDCISCLTCWDMAKDLILSRLDMGSACEKNKIRIKPCQLGIF